MRLHLAISPHQKSGCLRDNALCIYVSVILGKFLPPNVYISPSHTYLIEALNPTVSNKKEARRMSSKRIEHKLGV